MSSNCSSVVRDRSPRACATLKEVEESGGGVTRACAGLRETAITAGVARVERESRAVSRPRAADRWLQRQSHGALFPLASTETIDEQPLVLRHSFVREGTFRDASMTRLRHALDTSSSVSMYEQSWRPGDRASRVCATVGVRAFLGFRCVPRHEHHALLWRRATECSAVSVQAEPSLVVCCR